MVKKIKIYLIVFLAIILVLGAGYIGLKMYTPADEPVTSKIGFEDIGELATQSAYCTEVNVSTPDRKLLGITIPFTQSKYIYSNDFSIKAGFDFGEVDWSIEDKKITVKLPEVKILSNEAVDGSFKVFHEQESIFRRVSLEENNDAFEAMKKSAEEHAIENGLFDNAKKNAEAMLTSFFGSVYDMNTYEIEFVYE